MSGPQISGGSLGDTRYYKRSFNFALVWNLQHDPRRRLVESFIESFCPLETDRILDLGTANLPEPLENIFEYYYPYKHRIVAAGVEDCSFLEAQYPGLRFVQTQSGMPLPFSENAFEFAFSNATIEHVGSRQQQSFFLKELIRVARRVFISTPNRGFPIELHTRLPFIHWLPPMMFRAIIKSLGYDFYAQEANLNLLSDKDLLKLVPQPAVEMEVKMKRNYFMGFASNLILIVKKEGSAQCE